MSNDLRSWFVTFPNGMIPLVEIGGSVCGGLVDGLAVWDETLNHHQEQYIMWFGMWWAGGWAGGDEQV
ncbi:hypothetical protein E3N88_45864 [Mikania micrantha]|uniref:Uncharacterized protein n=1 Tax=Mikania micrantha TaxID=192012 RepID=A0A5N6L8J8_9ASTR|nr:hypothetical protein E3N88_45864 [Mikania micrantha]